MTRRGFTALAAAPLIVQPTLEDIERTWKRRFFPGWTPSNQFWPVQRFNQELLAVLRKQLFYAGQIKEYRP